MKWTQSLATLLCIAILVITTMPNSSFADDKTEKEYASKSISRYPVPNFDELPDDLKQIFKGMEKQRGFVPNIMKALAHRPAELRAFMAYYKALAAKKSGLTLAEREMLLVAFSSHNGCTYCVVSHGASLRKATKNPYLSEQIATNYKEADITPRQQAIIDFALKVTNDSRSINENDYEILRGHGLSNEDIWDIAGFTAFFNLSNRMMNFLKVRPDAQFYAMGR